MRKSMTRLGGKGNACRGRYPREYDNEAEDGIPDVEIRCFIDDKL
jgi:hypothetical protein